MGQKEVITDPIFTKFLRVIFGVQKLKIGSWVGPNFCGFLLPL